MQKLKVELCYHPSIYFAIADAAEYLLDDGEAYVVTQPSRYPKSKGGGIQINPAWCIGARRKLRSALGSHCEGKSPSVCYDGLFIRSTALNLPLFLCPISYGNNGTLRTRQ
jgi:hypothetical protein